MNKLKSMVKIMKIKYTFVKLIGIGIIVLFIGASIIPSISANNFIDSKDIFNRFKRENKDLSPKDSINPYDIFDDDIGWAPIEVVSSESTSYSFWPSVAIGPDDTVHVVWFDETNYDGSGYDVDIFYKYKPTGGVWSNTEVVSTESTQHSYWSSLAVGIDGTVHVVWGEESFYGNSGNDCDIFYKNKPSGGSWSITEVVSTESNNFSGMANIAVDNDGNLHVTWMEEVYFNETTTTSDVLYKLKLSGGSWTDNPTELVSTESDTAAIIPVLDVDSYGTAHIAWSDCTDYNGSGTDEDIFYKYKPSGGSWSSTELVTYDSDMSSYWPSLSVESDGTVHIAWDEDDFGTTNKNRDLSNVYIYYKTKPVGGSMLK